MKIVVVGSGIVGQATGIGLSKDHQVTFLDINPEVVEALSLRGFDARLVTQPGELHFDIVMLCVSTPSAEDGSVNLSHIKSAMDDVEKLLLKNNKWSLVVVRSTVPPTTTERVLVPLLERNGLLRGRDFGVCMQPEFLRAKSSVEDFANPWVTVIGELDTRSGDLLTQVYQTFSGKLFRVSIAEAEMIKYVHNLRNALVISFANEMWLLNQHLGEATDINKVLSVVTVSAESAWNPQYGSVGGQPYGGTCLPKDTNGLLHFAGTHGLNLPLLAAVIAVNTIMEDLATRGQVPSAQIEGLCWKPAPVMIQEVSRE